MLNFYEIFACGQAACEIMKKIEPTVEAAEKIALRLAAPAGIAVMIVARPVVAPLAKEVKYLFAESPTSQTRTVESHFDEIALTVQTAETRKPPFNENPRHAPALWNLVAATTASGDAVQTYAYYSPTERYVQKISAPDWLHEESSLPNQPAPAYFGVKIV